DPAADGFSVVNVVESRIAPVGSWYGGHRPPLQHTEMEHAKHFQNFFCPRPPGFDVPARSRAARNVFEGPAYGCNPRVDGRTLRRWPPEGLGRDARAAK